MAFHPTPPRPPEDVVTAADLRMYLARVGAERLDAVEAGLSADGAYMDDLETELAELRDAYAVAAVTEMASLRAELGGKLEG